jgi:MFS family permease
MTGKQTGWVYATFPLACIFAPFASGYLADKQFNAEHIILVSHAIGAILLVIAAKQTKFWGMFLTMLLYSVFYTATLPLVNKVLFRHVPDQATYVFLWAPVAWALVGYFLTGLRQLRKVGGDGPDSLYLAAVLSAFMVVVAFFQPATEPKPGPNPMVEAFGMLADRNYLIFMLAQLVVSGMMQFYFLGTGQFLQDRGVNGKNVSAIMAIAQAVQAIATIFLLDQVIAQFNFRWTFVFGAVCWSVLYLFYVLSKANIWIVVIQAFHGLAYVLFMIGGQIFVGKMAPSDISASAQSLIFIATSGVGLFLGTQLAGIVMEKNSVGGKFQWQKIWAVPLGITLAGAIVFASFFRVPDPNVFRKSAEPAAEQMQSDMDSVQLPASPNGTAS